MNRNGIAWNIMWYMIGAVLCAGCIALFICGCTKEPDQTATKTAVVETTAAKTVLASTEATTEAKNELVTDNSESTARGDDTRADNNGGDVTKGTEATTEEETTLSAEEMAQVIINNGINGDEREAYLGDRYKEVQAWIDENYIAPTEAFITTDNGTDDYEPDYYYPQGDGVLTADKGVNYYYGVLETYYNLDMSGVVDWMHSLGYGGEYWVRGDGVKMLGDYVMVAADYDYEPKGTITETSLGLGIVCDTGLGGWAWHDIAVDW